MSHSSRTIIITGDISSGKTTFLQFVTRKLQKNWHVDGLLSFSEKRKFKAHSKSDSYTIKMISSQRTLPWAKRDPITKKFDFNLESRATIFERYLTQSSRNCEIFIFDNLGKQELKSQGLHQLMENVRDFPPKYALVLSIQKGLMEELIQKYEIQNPLILDLDTLTFKEATQKVKEELFPFDTEKITLFASGGALFEIGVGSILHSIHLPLGFLLSGTQNLLLLLFSRNLRGRGILSIVTVTAALKSFSPSGPKLKPMFYIFMQGFSFWIPSYLMGVNFFSLLFGSVLLEMSTVFLSLGVNYLLYGSKIFESYVNSLDYFINFFHFHQVTLLEVIGFVLLLKMGMGALLTLLSYLPVFDRVLEHILSKVFNQTSGTVKHKDLTTLATDWKSAFKGAIGDLQRPLFIVSIFITLGFIFFFTKNSWSEIILLGLRALFLSLLGFTMARKINFPQIVQFLKRRNHHQLALTLEKTLALIQNNKNRKE